MLKCKKKDKSKSTKTFRSSVLCEAALPPAVFVSLSLLLSLCSCFKLNAGSLKGRFFKCVGLQAHIVAQTQKERAELGVNAVAVASRDTLSMFLAPFLSMLEAAVEADTPPSWVLIDVCFYIRPPYPIMLYLIYHCVFNPCSILQTPTFHKHLQNIVFT